MNHTTRASERGDALWIENGYAPLQSVLDESLAPPSQSFGFGSPVIPDGGIDKDTLLRCACPSCVKSALKNGLDPAVLDSLGLGRSDARGSAGDQAVGVNGDEVPDTPHSDPRFTLSLDPDARPIESRINDGADRDLFRIELKAGQIYQFDLGGKPGSGDLVLALTDAAGVPLAGAESDSGGAGEGERLIYTPSADGVYFISVRSFTPLDVGDYSVSAKAIEADPRGSVVPTDSLDWGGTQNIVNTDGRFNAEGDRLITVYFSKLGEVYQGLAGSPVTSEGWNAYEKQQAFIAFQQYENVAKLDYVEVANKADADFVLVTFSTAPVLLGRMSAPGTTNEGQGEFNRAGVGWDENPTPEASGLAQGGYGFITLIHEFGHGHGLAHPHDTGGGSTVMRGVESDSDPGVFNLNQGIHTTMSYRSGAPNGPNRGSPSDNYGYEGTLSSLDIAVIQAKYGANMDYRTGDDTYVLKDVNAIGTFYETLWDAGGIDTIVYEGARGAVIDLRQATLRYEPGGGGFLSYVNGIHGGFLIANGVVVENARGGSGDDRLTGNSAANQLFGGAGADELDGLEGADFLHGNIGDDLIRGGVGNDIIFGGQGNDRLFGNQGDDFILGGLGDDILTGGLGDDTLDGADGRDTVSYANATAAVSVSLALQGAGQSVGELGFDTLTNIEDLEGSAFGDTLSGDGGANVLNGLAGADTLSGGAGADAVYGGDGNDLINGNTDDDFLHGNLGDDTIYGGQGNDFIIGGQGSDHLFGSLGDDTLLGSLGSDILTGGGGSDVFLYHAAAESTATESDSIMDFESGVDRIDLRQVRASVNDSYEIIRSGTTTLIIVDIGGDGGVDMQIALLNGASLQQSDILF